MSGRHHALHWLIPGWILVALAFVAVGIIGVVNDHKLLPWLCMALSFCSTRVGASLSREHYDLANVEYQDERKNQA